MRSMLACTAFVLTLSHMGDVLANDSLLDQKVYVEGFGDIAYRAPASDADHTMLPIVLFHGVYGGASHRTFKNIVPRLDAAGHPVYLMDLPGVGESDKPKRAYRIEDLDRFIAGFLETAVDGRAVVVAESLSNLSALKVTSERPDLISRLVMINPAGLNSLNSPPTSRQQSLYDRLYADDEASLVFFQNLLVDSSLRFYLGFGFFDDSLIDDDVLNDYRVARGIPEQRWITISFVGGQFYRPFVEAAENVFLPVLGIFGKEYEDFADTTAATAADFAAVRPDFEWLEIENSGSIVQREKPEATATAILAFAERN